MTTTARKPRAPRQNGATPERPPLTAAEIVDAVREGRANDDFDNLVAAVQYQLRATNSQVIWRFQWEGRTIDKRFLPLSLCIKFQEITGQPYTVMHPGNAEHARAIIAALLITEGEKLTDAIKRASEANGWEIVSTLVEEAAPGDPFSTTSTG